MMEKGREYILNILKIAKNVLAFEEDNMHMAAKAFAEAIASGHRIHAFGTGHSHLMAEELFYRAGGLVNINPIFEEGLMLHTSASKGTMLERLPGYGDVIFESNDMKAGDLLLIASNSGRNAVVIDLAATARKHGLIVIVLTNLKHAESGASRHPSGKKLHDFADIVLDNMGCAGDASIPVKELGRNVAPTSTVIGAMILNAVEAEAVEILCDMGVTPEVFASCNIDGGDLINEGYVRKYKGVLNCL